jgi:MFS family permease
MALGQITVAIAPSIEVAVVGRVLVGIGDATTFVSGLRIISAWFRPRKVPVMQQWFGNLGQVGQFLSAVPFATLLHLTEWTTAFLTTASLSVIVFVAGAIALRDAPGQRFVTQPGSIRTAFTRLGEAFARPGTRLGFWSHFTTQFIGNVFGLLWGYPLMVQGLGLDPSLASVLLIMPVVTGMIVGPWLGLLTARYPLRRSNIVIAAAATSATFWVVLLLWPGTPPLWYFLLVLFAMGCATTGSNIGFDFARTFNPSSVYGSASGIVNIGGFLASGIAFFSIGLAVDLMTGGATPDWGAFRVAMWTMPVLTALGIIAILVERHRTRGRMAAEEGVVVAPLWLAIVRRIRHDRGSRE